MKTIIIGLGNIGMLYDIGINSKEIYYSHTKSLINLGAFQLLCGVDVSAKNRNLLKKKYKLPVEKNIELSLKKYKPELVVISTSGKSHLEIVKQVAKFKYVKFIVLEKPGGQSNFELKLIYKICEKNNIKIVLNYFRLFDPYFLNIAKQLSNKSLEAVINYKRGVRNNCTHFLSFLFFVKLPKSISDIKIKILNFNSEKSKNNKSFIIEWGNIRCFFISPNIKKLSLTKIEIFTKKNQFISNNNFTEFKFFKKTTSFLINNVYEYKDEKLLKNINIHSYQKTFYNSFLQKLPNYNKLKKVFLMTALIADKIEKKIKKNDKNFSKAQHGS